MRMTGALTAAIAAFALVETTAHATAIAESGLGFRINVESSPLFGAPVSIFTYVLTEANISFSGTTSGAGVAEGPNSARIEGPIYSRGLVVAAGVRASSIGIGSATATATYTGRIRVTNIGSVGAPVFPEAWLVGNEGPAVSVDDLALESASFQQSAWLAFAESPGADIGYRFECTANPALGGIGGRCGRPFAFTQAGSGFITRRDPRAELAPGDWVDLAFQIDVSATVTSRLAVDVAAPAGFALFASMLAGLTALRRTRLQPLSSARPV